MAPASQQRHHQHCAFCNIVFISITLKKNALNFISFLEKVKHSFEILFRKFFFSRFICLDQRILKFHFNWLLGLVREFA